MTAKQPTYDDECGCGLAEGGAWPLYQALAVICQMATPIRETQSLLLAQTVGRVLAKSLFSSDPLPRFDHAAMDGYAVRRAELVGRGPWHLPIGQRVAAGQSAAPHTRGQIARIFTGAPIPAGADAVVMQEQVAISNGLVRIDDRPTHGAHIRRRGEEAATGAELLASGRRLSARDVGVAACAGVTHLEVIRPVRIALLTTGDELCRPGETATSGRIADVNTPMLTAALGRPDVMIVQAAHVLDTAENHRSALKSASKTADIILTTGGVSVGEEDHVRAAVRALGGQIHIPAVAIKPGKPVTVGRLGGAIWLGLPGNPMSACLTFMLFGLPLIASMAGATDSPERRYAVAGNEITRRPGRCELRPAMITGQDDLGRPRLSISGSIHSGRMTPLCRADGCAVVPADAERIAVGDRLEFLQFPEGL